MKKKENRRRYTMLKQFAVLMLAAATLISVSAAETTGQTTGFSETVCGFDGETGRHGLPSPWVQNRTRSFEPFGKVEIIKAPFGDFQKALRITSGKAHTHVYTTDSIPVKPGDVLKVDVTFRSPDGKTPVYFGIYPKRFGPDSDFQNMRLKPVGKKWDSRYGFFEIKKPQTQAVRFFISGPQNSVTDFSRLSFRKLRADETPVYLPSKNLKMWEERTLGTNLAFRKKVKFHPAPNYALTAKGGTDAGDLTDGKVHRGSGMIHFQSEAVGWSGRYGTISIMVDLGEVKPVGKGVIRVNGGREKWIPFPKKLTIWGSRDGKNFFRGQSLTKLNKLENYLSNFKDFYYLPESEDGLNTTYVYPFELELNADVRYVVFQLDQGGKNLFCDEAAVIQADPKSTESKDFNRIFQQMPRQIFHESIVLRPKMDTMYIAEGKWFPNYLILDCRKKDQGERFTFSIDMPSAVEFHFARCYPYDIRMYEGKENKARRTVYKFKSGKSLLMTSKFANDWGFGPFFFKVAASGLVPAEESFASFSTYCNGKLEKTAKIPLKILKMPEVPRLQRMNNSLWIAPRGIYTWPDFLTVIRSVGINALPVFPEWKDEVPMLEKYLKTAVQSPNLFRMVLGPVGRPDRKAEFFCPTQSTVRTACLAYRGPDYQKMLDQIAGYVRKYPCDYLTFDVESWEPQTMNNSMKCPRCDELRKKMKMNWVEYFSWAQAEYLKPFKLAVIKGAKAAGRKPPMIGYYALSPGSTAFRYNCAEGPVDFLGGFSRMFPKYTDEAQFCHYGRDTATVHHKARLTYETLKNPAICNPWISVGTGAYYTEALPNRTAQHFLEAVLNGSCGVQIFSSRSLESPLDYYCFAQTVKLIAPFEDLIMDGSLDSRFAGSNKKLLYTKRDWKGKSLILIGNYETATAAETILPVKGKVTDLVSGKTFRANGSLRAEIPADDFRLLLAE